MRELTRNDIDLFTQEMDRQCHLLPSLDGFTPNVRDCTIDQDYYVGHLQLSVQMTPTISQRVIGIGIEARLPIEQQCETWTARITAALQVIWRSPESLSRKVADAERVTRDVLTKNAASTIEFVSVEPTPLRVIDDWQTNPVVTVNLTMLGDRLEIEPYASYFDNATAYRQDFSRLIKGQRVNATRRAVLDRAGASAFIDRATLGVIRHMGGDPENVVRLIGTQGGVVVRKHEPTYTQMSLELRDGIIVGVATLAPTTYWSIDRLEISDTILPDAVAMGLAGQRLSSVVDHPSIDPTTIIERVAIDDAVRKTTFYTRPDLLFADLQSGRIWQPESVD